MVLVLRAAPNRLVKTPAHLDVDIWLAAKHGVMTGDPQATAGQNLVWDQGRFLANKRIWTSMCGS
jgi:hypothetical protein